jgi:hypothetical protein
LGPEGAILPALFLGRVNGNDIRLLLSKGWERFSASQCYLRSTDSFIWAKGLYDSEQLPAWNMQFVAPGWRFISLPLTL